MAIVAADIRYKLSMLTILTVAIIGVGAVWAGPPHADAVPPATYTWAGTAVSIDQSTPYTATAECAAGDKAVNVGYLVSNAAPVNGPIYVRRLDLDTGGSVERGRVTVYLPGDPYSSGTLQAFVTCLGQ